jgi:hypothetical protein
VHQTLPRLGIDFKSAKNKTFEQLIIEKKTRNNMRPCFLVDPKFLPFLPNFKNKEELNQSKSQSNIYQKGINMIFLNHIPIAAACFLQPKVVEDSLRAIFNAIYNLVTIGENIIIKTGFCNIYFIGRNLKYSFSPEILGMVKDLGANQVKLKRGVTPIRRTWKTSMNLKWSKSVLSTLLERPKESLIKTIDNKSKMLKIMSLDMASTYTNGFRPMKKNMSQKEL